MSITVLVVDDHIKVHQGLAALIDATDDIEIVGHGSNGAEALQLCEQLLPNVVLMDVMMPVMDGITATKQICTRFPSVRVLAMSSFNDSDSVRQMLEAGAIGYILKTASVDDVTDTIRVAHAGKSVFSAEVTQTLLMRTVTPSTPSETFGLTPREREILALLAEGKNNNEIASALYISVSTAKFHVSSIFAKMNVSNRVEAVALAKEKKLV
jgi:NarL family two-component system response regulator LiaR